MIYFRCKKANVMKGMCDEDVMYLGYFSSQEKMIQQVLREQSDVAQTHLKGVVHRAAIHCRRDSLWSSLLPRSLKEENSSKEVLILVMLYLNVYVSRNILRIILLDLL